MSVKLGLMVLLAERAMYGYELRSEFETRTGGTWPLNVGQVYTTLARLERDGLVEPRGAADAEGRIAYALTPAGREVSAGWWRTPVTREASPRDELVIKLALAVTTPDVDVSAVVQTQRTATMRHLRELTRLKAASPPSPDEPTPTSTSTSTSTSELNWSLILEHHLFAAEAEARWLDHVEAALARDHSTPTGKTRPAPRETTQPAARAAGVRR